MRRAIRIALVASVGVVCAAAIARGGTLTTLYSFTGHADGGYPNSVIYVNGLIYGSTVEFGKLGEGTVFRIDPATGAEHVLYSFRAGADGAFPSNGLTFADGLLYGSAYFGAGYGCFGLGCGSVFAVNAATGHETHLTSFGTGADGASPEAAPVIWHKFVYGTTSEGGSGDDGCVVGCGVVYRIDPAHRTQSVLHQFAGGADGAFPFSELVPAGALLYGTTAAGGAGNNGTVFAIDPSNGKLTTLYDFVGGKDGAEPESGLTYRAGVFYGTTLLGGPAGLGTVFSVTADGSETVLHAFGGGANDGASPSGAVILVNGVLYGMTTAGGTADGGTLFSVDIRNGKTLVLESFPAGGTLSPPAGNLVYQAGVFYGVTCCNQFGTVFEFTK